MLIRNRIKIVFFALVFIATGFFYSCSKSASTYPSYAVTTAEQQSIDSFITLANQHRQSVGCTVDLIWDHDTHVVAQLHSLDMQQNSYFSHTGLNGSSPWVRLANNNVSYIGAAENIAINSMDANSVLQAWINSSGHRANLENCTYTHHGVGLASPGRWTHVFLRR